MTSDRSWKFWVTHGLFAVFWLPLLFLSLIREKYPRLHGDHW